MAVTGTLVAGVFGAGVLVVGVTTGAGFAGTLVGVTGFTVVFRVGVMVGAVTFFVSPEPLLQDTAATMMMMEDSRLIFRMVV